MQYRYPLLILILVFFGCQKAFNKSELQYAPTDVLVGIKGTYPIDSLFHFINGLDHELESITSMTYTSSLPSDSLQYVLDQLNAKAYTTNGSTWNINGYLHHETNQITVFPQLYDMKDLTHQNDWLNTIDFLELTPSTSNINLYFHVPEGEEKFWVEAFEKRPFVVWAELNYMASITHG